MRQRLKKWGPKSQPENRWKLAARTLWVKISAVSLLIAALLTYATQAERINGLVSQYGDMVIQSLFDPALKMNWLRLQVADSLLKEYSSNPAACAYDVVPFDMDADGNSTDLLIRVFIPSEHLEPGFDCRSNETGETFELAGGYYIIFARAHGFGYSPQIPIPAENTATYEAMGPFILQTFVVNYPQSNLYTPNKENMERLDVYFEHEIDITPDGESREYVFAREVINGALQIKAASGLFSIEKSGDGYSIRQLQESDLRKAGQNVLFVADGNDGALIRYNGEVLANQSDDKHLYQVRMGKLDRIVTNQYCVPDEGMRYAKLNGRYPASLGATELDESSQQHYLLCIHDYQKYKIQIEVW